MICQRSGSCCVSMGVVIRVGERLKFKPDGVACPHLSYDGAEASCAVHEEPWFKDMPCDTYGNPDKDPDFEVKRGRPCMVGQYYRKTEGGLPVLQPHVLEPADPEKLEDLGPWDNPSY